MAEIRLPHRTWLLGVAGAALLATAGHPASAATVTAIYSGYVQSGIDRGGLFGQAGANLAGLAYTAVYTIDTAVGHQTLSPGNYSGVYGGGCCGSPTPVVASAVLTINGRNDTIDGTDDGGTFVSALGYYPPQATTAHHSTGGIQYIKDGVLYNFYQAIYNNAYSDTNPLIGWDYRNSYTIPTTPDVSSVGLFIYQLNHVGPDGRLVSDFSTELRLSGVFDPNPGPGPRGVPEPASWVTMLAGFAALGAAMRSRRAASRRTGCGQGIPT